MLTKPILASVRIFDAKKNNTITFTVIGGNQINGFEYEIYNNTTSELITNTLSNSVSPSFTITSDTLTNGVEYRLRVRTKDSSNNYSEFSDYMIVKCYSEAIVTITNFTIEDGINKVKNQKYIFEGLYSQLENISLKSFYYIIYDDNGNIKREYPVIFQQSGLLQQYINGLDNYTWYRIELKCTDQNDIVTSSGIIRFYVEYKPPRIRQIVNLTNDRENASVRIDSDVRQLIFQPVGDYEFLDNDYIDLTNENSSVYMDDAFTIDIDFTLQAWIKSSVRNKDLIILKDIHTGDCIRIQYKSDNRIHVRKNIGTIIMEYISDVVDVGDSEFTIYIKQVNRRIDAICEVI